MTKEVLQVKVVLLGSQGSGKSSIAMRFVANMFTGDAYDSNAEDVYIRKLRIKDNNKQHEIELSILDAATVNPKIYEAVEEERTKKTRDSISHPQQILSASKSEHKREHYCEHFKPNGLIFVFSVEDSTSFANTCSIVRKEENLYNTYHARNSEYPPFDDLSIMFVGNKCESKQRGVEQEEIINVCSEYNNASYVEVSAKDDIGIYDLFHKLCLSILQKNGQWGNEENKSCDVQCRLL